MGEGKARVPQVVPEGELAFAEGDGANGGEA